MSDPFADLVPASPRGSFADLIPANASRRPAIAGLEAAGREVSAQRADPFADLVPITKRHNRRQRRFSGAWDAFDRVMRTPEGEALNNTIKRLGGSGSLFHLGANVVGLINQANDFLVEKTGVGKPSNETMFAAAEDWLRQKVLEGIPSTQADDFLGKVREALIGAPAAVAQYATGARLVGPVAGFAGVEALHAADQGPEAAAEAALRGAGMGAAFKFVEPLTTLLKAQHWPVLVRRAPLVEMPRTWRRAQRLSVFSVR